MASKKTDDYLHIREYGLIERLMMKEYKREKMFPQEVKALETYRKMVADKKDVSGLLAAMTW